MNRTNIVLLAFGLLLLMWVGCHLEFHGPSLKIAPAKQPQWPTNYDQGSTTNQ